MILVYQGATKHFMIQIFLIKKSFKYPESIKNKFWKGDELLQQVYEYLKLDTVIDGFSLLEYKKRLHKNRLYDLFSLVSWY